MTLASAARAQSVTGTVVDSTTNRPLESFTISLVNESGAVIRSAFAESGGEYHLVAPAAGRYRLRVLRIGYRRTETPLITLGTGATRSLVVRMPRITTQLAALKVDARQSCDDITDGSATATVWDEVRKAAQAVQLTDSTAALRMMVRDDARSIALTGNRRWDVESALRAGRSVAPYIAPPADSIARYGFVQPRGDSLLFLAPDAPVLTSDVFVRTHCFALRDGGRDRAHWIGVAFQPVRDAHHPDIEGVAWVDRASSELREVEFHYTGLAREMQSDRTGGRVAYQPLSDGRWITSEWLVRAPLMAPMERGRVASIAHTNINNVNPAELRLAGLREASGVVISVIGSRGEVVWLKRPGSLVVTVLDSTTRAPLANIPLTIAPTDRKGTTDVRGQLQLDSLPAGTYAVTASVVLADGAPLRREQDAIVGGDASSAGTVLELLLPIAEQQRAQVARVRAMLATQCALLRRQRQRDIDSTLSAPPSRWRPSGDDSAATARAAERAFVILQAATDTLGVPDMTHVRTIRRGPAATYALALDALAAMRQAPQEAQPGCTLPQLVLLPYNLKPDK